MIALVEIVESHGVHVPEDAVTRYARATGVEYLQACEEVAASFARAAGIVWACHGCGSVGAVAGTEEDRVSTRDAIDWDDWGCCPDATTSVL